MMLLTLILAQWVGPSCGPVGLPMMQTPYAQVQPARPNVEAPPLQNFGIDLKRLKEDKPEGVRNHYTRQGRAITQAEAHGAVGTEAKGFVDRSKEPRITIFGDEPFVRQAVAELKKHGGTDLYEKCVVKEVLPTDWYGDGTDGKSLKFKVPSVYLQKPNAVNPLAPAEVVYRADTLAEIPTLLAQARIADPNYTPDKDKPKPAEPEKPKTPEPASSAWLWILAALVGAFAVFKGGK